jgi:hypothetical protein
MDWICVLLKEANALTSALKRLRQEDEVEPSLSYLVRPCLKEKIKTCQLSCPFYQVKTQMLMKEVAALTGHQIHQHGDPGHPVCPRSCSVAAVLADEGSLSLFSPWDPTCGCHQRGAHSAFHLACLDGAHGETLSHQEVWGQALQQSQTVD